jgi:ATP-dependent HslUV protease ATP-binding subunit HslU
MVREQKRAGVAQAAKDKAEERLLDALVGAEAQRSTRDVFRKKLRAGELDDKDVDIDFAETAGGPMQMLDLPGQQGAMGMINLSEILGKAMGQRTKRVRTTVKDAYKPLLTEEADKLVDEEQVVREALIAVEEDGIVFLDEIDKIAARKDRGGADVSREGVQRDLLPLIEGTTVATKYGPVKTDHILFIASGAFHVSKPSDLLPELQGRLPIRVELKGLTRDDFKRILNDTEASLVRQYVALLGTEGVALTLTDDGIDAIARTAEQVNEAVENIGARRLQTVMEKLLESLSFDASERAGDAVTVDAAYVERELGDIARDTDLSKFIL